jgi:nitrite reductase/ring-hydroxylating ferredoxin subunit
VTPEAAVVAVCPLAAVEVEGARWVGDGVAVVRHRGELHAFQERCPHAAASLAEGALHHGQVTCPQHGARFRLRDGKALAGPTRKAMRCFDVEQAGDEVLVRPRTASPAPPSLARRLAELLHLR